MNSWHLHTDGNKSSQGELEASESGSSEYVFARIWSAPGELGIPVDPVRPHEQDLSEPTARRESSEGGLKWALPCKLATTGMLALAAWISATAIYIERSEANKSDSIEWSAAICSVVSLLDVDEPTAHSHCCTLVIDVDPITDAGFLSTAAANSEMFDGFVSVQSCNASALDAPVLATNAEVSACKTLTKQSNISEPYPCYAHKNLDILNVAAIPGAESSACFRMGAFTMPNALPRTGLSMSCVEGFQGSQWRIEGTGDSVARDWAIALFVVASIATCCFLGFLLGGFKDCLQKGAKHGKYETGHGLQAPSATREAQGQHDGNARASTASHPRADVLPQRSRSADAKELARTADGLEVLSPK